MATTKILFPNNNNKPPKPPNDPPVPPQDPPKPPKPPKDKGPVSGDDSGGPKKPKPKKSLFKRILKIGGILMLLGLLAGVGFYFSVLYGAFGKLPTKADLMLIQNPVASEIYAADGVLLGKYYTQNRSFVPFKQISPYVVNALVSTEDARFFKHKGVDTRSMFRVLIMSILLQRGAGGGSTISQQLIKNIFPRESYGPLSMPVNKTKEAIIARRLEKVYSKKDILELYLNTVSFGERAYGIGTASERFFSTKPKDLSIQEAATLVGMLKATTSYSPRRNPKKSKVRRNVVLNQMAKFGHEIPIGQISQATADKLKKTELVVKYNRTTHSDGLAPYFRETLKQELKEWCKNNKKADGSDYNLYTDGLKIYTSINSKMQAHAEAAVKSHMKQLQKDFLSEWGSNKPWRSDYDFLKNAMENSERFRKMKASGKSRSQIDKAFNSKTKMLVFDWNSPNYESEKLMTPIDSIKYYQEMLSVGFMAMEPTTGYIRAWVGGIDHSYFKYDHTLSKRQVGSTFKPFVYATALENGAEPCNFYENELRLYTDLKDWTPGNADDEYGGEYSMRGALAKSVNTVSVQIMLETGVKKVVDFAKKMGITSHLPEVPSITLGTAELTLNEMVSAYCAFPNGGYQTPAIHLTKIIDQKGRKYEYRPTHYKYRDKAMKEETANMMQHMMEAVVDSGTARRLRFTYNMKNDIGGKTGTTQNQTDGWFIGYTPDLVAGAWVGGQDRRIHFKTIRYGQGANAALPIWGKFMQKVYDDPALLGNKQPGRFAELSYQQQEQLNCPIFREQAPLPPPAVVNNNDRQYDNRGRQIVKPKGFKGGNKDNKANRPDGNSSKSNRPKGWKPEKQKAKGKKKKGNFWDRLFKK